MTFQRDIDKVLANLRKQVGELEAEAAPAILEEVETEIMAEAMKQVPRDTGTLANSRFVDLEKGPEGPRVRFGFRERYAVFVHEIGPERARHKPPTKWKYLEDPIKAWAGKAVRNLTARLKGALR